MKTNILKQIRSFSMVTATILLVGCGGGGGDSSASVDDDDTSIVVKTTVSGNAVDGPIYGATVNVYSLTGTTVLATIKTSSDANTLGDFLLDVPNLPTEYIIRIIGGRDAGPDGVKNANDEVSTFDMSSVGIKGEANNTTYVSPATSLIVENIKPIIKARSQFFSFFLLKKD